MIHGCYKMILALFYHPNHNHNMHYSTMKFFCQSYAPHAFQESNREYKNTLYNLHHFYNNLDMCNLKYNINCTLLALIKKFGTDICLPVFFLECMIYWFELEDLLTFPLKVYLNILRCCMPRA